MIEWVQKRMSSQQPLSTTLEELLDELVAKEKGNEYGMDNMSSILISFDH